MRAFALLALLGLHRAALAQTVTGAPTPTLADSLLQMLTGLGAVLAVMLGSVWLLKKMTGHRQALRGLRVIGASPVGPRERIVLVDIGPRVLVLGVTASSITRLDSLAPEELPQPATPPAAQAGLPLTGFAERLRQKLERRP